jgi:hypothetical protein
MNYAMPTPATYDSVPLSSLTRDGILARAHGTLLEITDLGSWTIEKGSAYLTHHGLILRTGNEFVLNGSEIIYRGPHIFVYLCAEGIIIDNGEQGLLNGKTPVEASLLTPTWNPPYGRADARNGEIVFEGISLPRHNVEQWEGTPEGILIRKANRLFLLVLRKRMEKSETQPNS